jgi:PAS domain S-box-containing protein
MENLSSSNDFTYNNMESTINKSTAKREKHNYLHLTKSEFSTFALLLAAILGGNSFVFIFLKYTSGYSLLLETIISSTLIGAIVFGVVYFKLCKPWMLNLKKKDEAVKYDRNLLKTLIDNLPDSVYIKDLDSRKIVANPIQVRLMGFDKEEDVINKNDYDIYPKDIADVHRQSDLKVFNTGVPELNKEHFYVDDNNETHWIITSKMPIKNETGEVTGLVGIGRDITDLKKANETIQKERNLLRTIIDNIPDAIYVKDKDCRKVIANPADVKNCGFNSEEELLHKNDYDSFPKEIADAFYTDDLFVLQTGNSVLNREEFFIDSDNNKHWLLSSKMPTKNELGKIIGLVGIGRDITKRKQLETELIDAKEKAEAASKAKSEFLANMSHEIRTPLNSVIGFSDLLLKSNLNNTQQQYISVVYHSANSLLDIINEILDFSKIEAGKLEIEIVKTDIFEIGYHIADVISFQAYKKDLELLLNIGIDIPRFIWADGVRLRQILINLLSNAVKFTLQGEIELKIETLQIFSDIKRKIRFSVRDTGIGINPENQKKVFEAFSQEDSSVTRKFGGTGLGLAISQKLVSLMDSELHLESVPGKGSTFYFDLIMQTQEGDAIDWKNLNNYTNILIVDDNANNRLILKDMLAIKGINCDEAENGEIALQKIDAGNKYDVVLMDYHMPVMDGLTAIEKIRTRYSVKQLPIILLHSSADDVIINEACLRFNVDQHLTKPLKMQHLFGSLSRLEYNNKQIGIKLNNETQKERVNTDHFKVLVADDNNLNIFLIRTIVEDILPNAQIIEAPDGEQALHLYKQYHPDIVFMDVQMPEMNGYDATKAIRSIEKVSRAPIIALTAAAVKDERDRCLSAGMNDYVTKPFVRDTIVNIINKWLFKKK